MKIEKPLLIFDFDGVISDSLHDSYVLSLNTYLRMGAARNLPLNAPIDPPNRIFDFEKRHPDLFEAFRRMIPLGNRAEDYFVIWNAIDSEIRERLRTQSNFEKFKRRFPNETLNAYAKVFYKSRKTLQEINAERWTELCPSFHGIPDAIVFLSERFELSVATSKDLQSVHLLLKKYGILRCFKPEYILDKDFSYSKRDHLTHFHEQFGIPFQAMHFIDDKVLHLLSIKTLGVKGYLALWGYNTKRERHIAEREGFRLLTIEGLSDLKVL